MGANPAPRTAMTTLRMAAGLVSEALPNGWSLVAQPRLQESEHAGGAVLQLTWGGRVTVDYAVTVHSSLTSREARTISAELLAAGRTGDRVWKPLVLSRYLSPQVRDVLRTEGISYADATGNFCLMSTEPLILLTGRGADSDPWRGPGRPTVGLGGLPAALLVRALVDFEPPYSVSEIAAAAGTSLGAAYRLIAHLADEGLLTRMERGPIENVNWPLILRRWALEAGVVQTSATSRFLEPRGVNAIVEKLARMPEGNQYAVSGSLAAQPYAAHADPYMVLLYAQDPIALTSALELRPVETGANLIVVAPRSPVVFRRTTEWRDITIVAPSQAAADLLAGPGRNPSEGEYLLSWMERSTRDWRRQLVR